MKSKHLLLGVWLMLIGFTLPIFAASTPTADNGKWYYVKSQRFEAGKGPWWTFDPATNQVVPNVLTKVDAQKFTLETTVEGKVTVKEFGGKLLTASNTTGLFDETGAETGWTMTANTVGGIAGFLFPGENSGLHQGNLGWGWRMTSGWYAADDFCTFFFYEVGADLDLALAVDDAIAKKANTAVGTNPTQTPQAAHDNFQAAIDAAKLTLGSTDGAAIQTAIDNLATATTTFNNAKVSPFATATPVADDGKWYYVKSQRYGSGGPWWTFTGDSKVVPGALAKTDAQKFTLVTTVAGKVGIQEFGGNKLTAAGGVFDATGAATGWTITPNTVNGIIGFAFPGENEGLHQGGGTWDWEMRAGGWYDITDFCTFFFFEDRADLDLVIAVEVALKKLPTIVAGTTPGTTLQSAIDEYKAAVDIAKATVGSTDETAIQDAIDALAAATTTLNNATIPIVQSSTEVAPIWYQIQGATVNTGDYHYNKAIYLNDDKSFTWKSSAVSDNQLFRFEKVGTTETYRIIAKIHPDGEMLNTTTPISYGTPVNTAWTLETLNGASGPQYRIKSGGKTLHMQQTGAALVSWVSGYNSASAFKFVSETDLVGIVLNSSITETQSFLDNSPEGTNPGEHMAQDRADMQTAINAAISVRDNAGSTANDKTTAVADLMAAKATFAATGNPIKYSDAESTTWYKIKSVVRTAQPYLTDGGINQGVLSVVDSEDQMLWWKIVDMGEGNVNIISRVSDGHIEIPAANSVTLKLVSTAQLWKTFSVGQAQFCFQSTTGTLRTWHLAGGFNLVAYGVPSVNSGESFLLEEVMTTPTAVEKQALDNINVSVVNRMLVVSGTTAKVQAYTVTGSQVDVSKQLNPGIYIVKVDNQTFKVNVR